MSKKVYYLEGNISCGKTTVIENLRLLGFKVFEEPLEEWQKKYLWRGRNILDLFYADKKEWAFKFEMVSMMTRYKQLKAALESLSNSDIEYISTEFSGGNTVGENNTYFSEGKNIVFIERSMLTDRYTFARNLYDNGIFNDLEWKIYCDLHDLFMELVTQMTTFVSFEYIYIQTQPEECFARKTGRNREEENSVAPSYFQELHDKHDDWLVSGTLRSELHAAQKVHTIQGAGSREEILKQIVDIVGTEQLIKKFIDITDMSSILPSH